MDNSSALSSSSSRSSNSIPVVQSWKRRRSLPELLAFRQTHGIYSSQKRRVDIPNYLSHRGAWSPVRMQNMILAVGPGTPASFVMGQNSTFFQASSSSSSSASSSSSSSSVLDDSDDENEQNRSSRDSNRNQTNSRPAGRAAFLRSERTDQSDDGSNNDDDEDDNDKNEYNEDQDDEEDDDDGSEFSDGRRQAVESALLEWYGGADSAEDDSNDESDAGVDQPLRKPMPSMRHGGCINTASWLDCGWRLSTVGTSANAVSSSECPTQLLTSGDDHLVKVWDVSHAMGMATPLPGGSATVCPFSAPFGSDSIDVKKSWKKHHTKTKSSHIAGSVMPLATVHTRHYGNVFHVTPLESQPGKVATCGADGFLRVTDLESGDASVVVSPEYEDDSISRLLTGTLMSLRSAMCFSHHFLNRNTGLLCSERGLRRFDLRLPPREQSMQNLLRGREFQACKACAIWSSPTASSSLEEPDSAYVFVGGSSADVALCDLRMVDSPSNRIIQRYRPSGLAMADHVSVSGLDLSKDKKELLVSYESDQIYTFPVFPQIKSPSGPTADQLRDLSKDSVTGDEKELNELAAYGGHLNRFTFLKNAKYAGPFDEYICTGSDSGHAWIYEKANGSVVSFLNADNSTCNGVIPHPTLPVFVTYGIDSTAKLWRGTTPVDANVDDSPEGRQKHHREASYEMSPVVRKWGEVQQVLKVLESEDFKESDILPDFIPNTKSLIQRGRFSRHFLGSDGPRGPRIGNDLSRLPAILSQNFYACLRSTFEGDDIPVESDIESLKHRISLIRLRHQADSLGISWDPSIPWAMKTRKFASEESDVHPADLVPNIPSDWIPYDPEMCKNPWDFENYFNSKDYGDFYRERYKMVENFILENRTSSISYPHEDIPTQGDLDVPTTSSLNEELVEKSDKLGESAVLHASKAVSSSSDEDDDDSDKRSMSVAKLLYETMSILKEGGNVALQEGKLDLAARRYDKAIQYGAVASMSFPAVDIDFATGRKEVLKESGGLQLEWTPVLKTLVMSRLNLALLMLKPHFCQPHQALEQAKHAVNELKPFCVSKGKVMKGGKFDKIFREDIDDQIFDEAIALQAKAYFRLGSAQYELGEYSDAISSFDRSVKSTKLVKEKPDNLLLKRLSEAKRENRRKNKRDRKKFKFDFGTNENQLNGRAKKHC